MRSHTHYLWFETRHRQEIIDITDAVTEELEKSGIQEGLAAAHLRSLTVGHEVIAPVTRGKLDFGPWQRVFYGEWDGQRRKRVVVKILGE